MTKCTSPSIVFQGNRSRKIMLDFGGGGAISGDGGLLLPGRLDRRLGLTRHAGKVLGGFGTRQPGKIRHLASDMFRQRVLSLAAGHEDLND